jgi:hypothetical protein
MRQSVQHMLCVFSIVFFGCKKENEQKPAVDYKFFNLQQQGWKSKRITQFANDINYTATEVPLYYYLLNNIGDDFAKVDSIYNANSKERIVEVEFQHTNEEDLLQEEFTNKSYEDAVEYMAFAIENDFMVVTSSNDTIPCSGVNFERNFKVAPFKRVLLYFNNINPNDNIKLIYQDHLFGNGIIKFNFQETPLKL